MKNLPLLAALLLTTPLAARAQAAPGPGDLTGTRPAAGRQVTEVTEELDPATGRVVRRTTRTYTAPSEAAPEVAPDAMEAAPAARPAARPAAGTAGRAAPAAARPAAAGSSRPATTTPGRLAPAKRTVVTNPDDALVSDFLRESISLSRLRADELPDIYDRFLEKVRAERRQWKAAQWTNAAAVLSRLNGRYEEVRQDLSFDQRLSIRTNQAEFQTLRTARQVSDQVTDKL